MKVAIVGDLFVINEQLQAALENAFKSSGIAFEYTYETFDWPVVPIQKNDEISEFVGDPERVRRIVGDAEIILTHSGPIPKSVIDSAKQLKIVGAARGGPVNINWKSCTERGIPVLYAPGRNSGAVAEFTVGMMLAQSRNITRCHMSMMNEKRWRGDLYTHDIVGNELGSSVVGLVGGGAVASKVARIVQGFGAEVWIYDPYIPEEKISAMGCKAVDLETLLKGSDYVSLHARLTKETAGMMDAQKIGMMKKTAYLINTARGELVQHDALYAALKDKRIAGAALDICEAEPLPEDSPVYTLDNVTVTSHLAGASIQAAEIGARVLAEGIYDYIVKKETPRYCVNPDYVQFTQGAD
jgi:D-3-phosphoglycerate dehydrogenase